MHFVWIVNIFYKMARKQLRGNFSLRIISEYICIAILFSLEGFIPTGPIRVTRETILWVAVQRAHCAPRTAPCICSLSWECVEKPIAHHTTITNKRAARDRSPGLTPRKLCERNLSINNITDQIPSSIESAVIIAKEPTHGFYF